MSHLAVEKLMGVVNMDRENFVFDAISLKVGSQNLLCSAVEYPAFAKCAKTGAPAGSVVSAKFKSRGTRREQLLVLCQDQCAQRIGGKNGQIGERGHRHARSIA